VIKTCGGKCGRIIPPMNVAKTLDAYEEGEPPSWAWPVYAFVAWLAAMLDYVAKFKRIRHTHRFKPNWRDSWQGLRQCEWLRDQLIAQGLRQLLAGQTLQLDDTQIDLAPPADYGGPRPRTPFDMNRRFLAIARWAADPEAIIRVRFRRLGVSGCSLRRASRATSPALRAVEENTRRAHRCLSSSSAQHWGRWHARACAHVGGGSRRIAFSARPRAPPTFSMRKSASP
jgi:hypothetical protein